MKSFIYFLFIFTLMATMVPTPAPAGDLTIPNAFQSGTPAVAAEVNANFTAVESAVDDNDSRINALEDALAALQATITSQASTISNQASTIATLESELAAVQSSQVMALDPYLSVDETTDSRGPLVQLAGVNLQIVNGLSSTDTINGLGNLIIGYDEVNTDTLLKRCSHGDYGDKASCEGADEIWSNSHKSGSHYLVMGEQNSYSQYGGIVAGVRNFTTNKYSTVISGWNNTARGFYSSVSAGFFNTASGGTSSISGGQNNTASGYASNISGGFDGSVSGSSDWLAGTIFEDE